MSFGKIEQGNLIVDPSFIILNGNSIINPDENELLEAGFLPLKYTNYPILKENEIAIEEWNVVGQEMVQSYRIEIRPLEDTEQRFLNLEKEMAQVKEEVQAARVLLGLEV